MEAGLSGEGGGRAGREGGLFTVSNEKKNVLCDSVTVSRRSRKERKGAAAAGQFFK